MNAASDDLFYSEQGQGRLYARTKVCERTISETVYVKAVDCFYLDISSPEYYIQTVGAFEPLHSFAVSKI